MPTSPATRLWLQVRCEMQKKSQWLLSLAYSKFLRNEMLNKWPVPRWTSVTWVTAGVSPGEYTAGLDPRILREGYKLYNSFIHSYSLKQKILSFKLIWSSCRYLLNYIHHFFVSRSARYNCRCTNSTERFLLAWKWWEGGNVQKCHCVRLNARNLPS